MPPGARPPVNPRGRDGPAAHIESEVRRLTPQQSRNIITPVLTRLAKVLVVTALAVSLGLHWAFLQTIAWAGMVASYSRTVPLKEAVSMTFDGKHPCNLCKLVRDGQRSEQQKEAQQPLVKLDLVCAPALLAVHPPETEPAVSPVVLVPPAFAQPPPVPPPKAA